MMKGKFQDIGHGSDVSLIVPAAGIIASLRRTALAQMKRWRLLEGDRSLTFLFMLLNVVVQVSIFLISLHKIIDNYYLDFKEKHPWDFYCHHFFFLVFVLFEALIVGFCLWISTHLSTMIIRRAVRYVRTPQAVPKEKRDDELEWPAEEDLSLSGDKLEEGLHARKHLQGRQRSESKGSASLWGIDVRKEVNETSESWVKRFWRHVTLEIVVLAVVEVVIFSICVLESRLLADMSVHFIDLDLVEIMGLRSVLKRQQSLGAGLAEEHWKYIYLIIVVLFVVQIGIVVLSRFLDQRLKKKRKYSILLFAFTLCVCLFFIAPYEHKILQERQNHFRSQLPFNFFDKEANKGLIPVRPKITTNFPPVLGEGYPVIDAAAASGASPEAAQERKAFPTVKTRKNVVVIVQESFRMSELQKSHSPLLHEFSERHKCVQPQYSIAPGHVSELSWFAIMYGLHPYHYHTFGLGHVLSYPMEVLKHNGYVTSLISASTCWPYPNANLFDNFQEFDSIEHNGDLMTRLDKFIERRTEDQKNFYLYLMMHKSAEEYFDVTQLDKEGGRQQNRDLLKDRDRMVAIDKLNRSGLLDESMVFIVSDHGDMVGEHGERGHGQKEGSWWNEKAVVPFFGCFFGKDVDMEQYNRHPFLTTHADVSPTYMSQLELDPPLDPKTYANGMSVLIPQSEIDPTKDRHVVCNARYFPKKNKINALIDGTNKMWFRVNGFNEHTQEMHYHPEMFTDMKDEQQEGCSLTALRNRFEEFEVRDRMEMATNRERVALGKKVVVGEKKNEEEGDKRTKKGCPSERFWGYLKEFDAEFWRFLALPERR